MKTMTDINELSKERDTLAKEIQDAVQNFEKRTGKAVTGFAMKIIRTPQGQFKDLSFDIDVFDDTKPKPKSNITIVGKPGITGRN